MDASLDPRIPGVDVEAGLLGGQDRSLLSLAKELQPDTLDFLPSRCHAQSSQRVQDEDRFTLHGLGVLKSLVESDGDIRHIKTDLGGINRTQALSTPTGPLVADRRHTDEESHYQQRRSAADPGSSARAHTALRSRVETRAGDTSGSVMGKAIARVRLSER